MNRTTLSILKRAFLLLCFSIMTCGIARSQVQQSPQHPVELRGTEVFHITSTSVGQEYDLYVSLPRGYDDTSKHFPVIYVLDAQWDFALTYSIYGQQYYDGFLPAAIIVGITWGGTKPNHDSLRARDLTPSHSNQLPQSGGAPKFLAFIKGELIPFVDARFRTAPNERTLMGSSFGGLFTLYALLHENELFNRYVLASPPIGWDNGVLYEYEKAYHARSSSLPAKVYIAVGSFEGPTLPGFEKFVGQLKERKYDGLELETRVVENAGHSGNKAEGYTRGLQAVFARPSVKLTTDVLKRYVGKYQISPQFVVQVIAEDGDLVILAPGNTRIPLVAENEERFYVRGLYMFVQFRKNDAGRVIGVEAEQFTGKQYAERID